MTTVQLPLIELPETTKMRILKRGHAGHPGRGPAGEYCRTCRHLTHPDYYPRYLKCGLTQPNWTRGAASDVHAKDPACECWEQEI